MTVLYRSASEQHVNPAFCSSFRCQNGISTSVDIHMELEKPVIGQQFPNNLSRTKDNAFGHDHKTFQWGNFFFHLDIR